VRTDEEQALRLRDDCALAVDDTQAKRDLRPATVQQTISGTFHCAADAGAFRHLRSVCSTWRKLGRSVLDALQAVFAGHSLYLRLPS